jgi:hypothetical protein
MTRRHNPTTRSLSGTAEARPLAEPPAGPFKIA